MKRIFTVLSCVGYALASQGQNKVSVHGEIKGLAAGSWVYYYPMMDRAQKDSVQSRTDGFDLSVTIPAGEGDVWLLQIGSKYTGDNFELLYLDKGRVLIKGEGPMFKGAKMSGTRAIGDYNTYKAYIKDAPSLKGRDELFKKANELYSKKDTAGYAALEPELNRMDSVHRELTKQWVLDHTGSPISAFILSFDLGRLELSEKEAIFMKLTAAAKENAPSKRIANSIRVNKLTGIGQVAMDFTQNDTAGKPVSLSSFRGKYVLVDFWASWCMPCRGENPNVVKAYADYKDKNFTVLGVSLDQPNGREKWLKAIHEDNLTWTQVSDLKFWSNAVAKQYDIQSIPANLLISPEGKIVGKDLHGEELEKKLAELLGPATAAGAGAGAAEGSGTGAAAAAGTVQAAGASGGDFVLNGQLSGKDGRIYIYYTGKGGKRIMDSTLVSGGRFSFKGSIEAPTAAYVVMQRDAGRKQQEANSAELYIVGGTMDLRLVQDDFAHANLKGSPAEVDYLALKASYEPVRVKYQQQLDSLEQENDHEKAAAIRERLSPYFEEMRQRDYDFFKAHPQSPVTAFTLRFHVADLSLEDLQGYYDRLGNVLQQSPEGRELADEIVKLRSGSPGSMAKDFTAMDMNGKALSLSAFKGKSVVLIDFWASWCVPCRHSNPHLKEVFQKYHTKGLEVIGVSDDDGNPAAWKKAVAQDGVGIWHNVLRGLDIDKIRKREPNEKDISEKFGIHSLPTKILIDRNGVIVGRYGEGREDEALLDKKLEEILL